MFCEPRTADFESNSDGFFTISSQWYTFTKLWIVLCGFMKVLYYIRMFKSFGLLVQMIAKTCLDVFDFLVFFLMIIAFFTFCFRLLGVKPDSPDEYEHLSENLSLFIIMFRTSLGDMSSPNVSDIESRRIIIIVWVIWLTMMVFTLIICLNFLIAVISQVYDEVIAEQK
jgi:hypothetical protein